MWEGVKKKLRILKEELFSYTGRERAFIIFAMISGFFICCHYAIIRPVSNSLFIHAYSAKLLPYAWLGTVPFNFLMVSIYNRLIPKWGSQNLFFGLIFLVTLTNLLFGLFAKTIPLVSFLFYVWKEIYILMMFQLLWSVIHANIKLAKAKYLYGLFFGIGGLGSMMGSFFPSFFAVAYGSENLIFWLIPVDLLLLFTYWRMSRNCSGDVPKMNREKEGGFLHGLQLIRGSRLLIFALSIVVFMQMITAIADFQFNDFLGRAFSDKDIRTEYSARIFGMMHTLSMMLQFAGTYILLKWIGFRRTHYLIPSLIGISASLFAVLPIFPLMSLTFITCKALDFSVFGVIREMLYIPLKPDEKFRAKAVIDVFAARSSKALASILIILVTTLVSSHLLTWLNLAIAILWIFSVTYGLREYEKVARN